MKNVYTLFNRLLVDISTRHKVALCAPRDVDMNWILNEAPALDKALLRYLETGEVSPCFPDWLTPLWNRFVTSCDVTALASLRQILVFGYKTEFKPNDAQVKAAEAAFVETDLQIHVWNKAFEAMPTSGFWSDARALVSRVIANANFGDITPSHGPGAVFPPHKHSVRSKFTTLYPKIDRLYPWYDHFQAISSMVEEGINLDKLGYVNIANGRMTARVTCVPKDSRGPRLICVHPREAIWIQQGLRYALEDAIASSPLTRDKIVFDDQTVNGRKALLGSFDGSYATIDLKDASDRISCRLAQFLLGADYQWFDCCRAESVELSDGSVHSLMKYAPMGNATVFPLQSLFFWALVRTGIRSSCGEICNDVYVFGDDIIVPTKFYHHAIRALVRAGLKPNPDKCFYCGLFRESCGVDAFNGVDITPVKMKRSDPSSLTCLVSMCSVAKAFRVRGYEEVSAALYAIVRRHFGKLPLSNNPDACGIYEYVARGPEYLYYNEPSFRWNGPNEWCKPAKARTLSKRPCYHRWETRIFLVIGVEDSITSHDWYHVQDSLLKLVRRSKGYLRQLRESEVVAGARDSGYPAPHQARLTCGWTPVLLTG